MSELVGSVSGGAQRVLLRLAANAPRVLTPRFVDALTFAAELHNEQMRKGTTVPYVSHLMSVCPLVLEDGGNETEAIAALLHNAVEDQGGAATREKIRERFGNEVTVIVDGCTDAETIPKPPWRERKERYIEHLRNAPPSVVRVSLADKLHNARSVLMDLRRYGAAVWDRFKGGKDGTMWYYRAVLDAVQTPSWLHDESVTWSKSLSRLLPAMSSHHEALQEALKLVVSSCPRLARLLLLGGSVEHRPGGGWDIASRSIWTSIRYAPCKMCVRSWRKYKRLFRTVRSWSRGPMNSAVALKGS